MWSVSSKLQGLRLWFFQFHQYISPVTKVSSHVWNVIWMSSFSSFSVCLSDCELSYKLDAQVMLLVFRFTDLVFFCSFCLPRYTKMKTATNIYIFNLALADSLFLATLPFQVIIDQLFSTSSFQAENHILTCDLWRNEDKKRTSDFSWDLSLVFHRKRFKYSDVSRYYTAADLQCAAVWLIICQIN